MMLGLTWVSALFALLPMVVADEPTPAQPAAQQAVASDLTLHYAVGNPNWRTGRTTLVVAPTGETKVTRTLAGTTHRWTGTLSEPELANLLQHLEQAGIWELKRDRPGIPDEAMVEIQLARDGEVVRQVEVWIGQLEEAPDRHQALQALEAVVTRVQGPTP
jgi:hypothetical protein